MLGFGDQRKHTPAADAGPMQRPTKWSQVRGVNVEELVFIKLHFDGLADCQNRDPRAAIVSEKLFKLTEVAGQNGQVDFIPAKIGMMVGIGSVAALQNDVYLIAKRIDQGEKGFKESFGGDRSRKHRQLQSRMLIAEHFNAIAFARSDWKSLTGPNRIGEMKLAVAIGTEMGSQSVRSHGTPSRQQIIQARDGAIT